MDLHGSRLRAHASLALSGGLVLVLGSLGLVFGSAATNKAVDVHRQDRVQVQRTLSELSVGYVQLLATDLDGRAGLGATQGAPFAATAGDPATVVRLQHALEASRTLDVGLALVDGAGRPLDVALRPGATLPAVDDPGWVALRTRAAAGRLPVSDVLSAGSEPALAIGVPTLLGNGTTGLAIGISKARTGGLQAFVAGLRYGHTGYGTIMDSRGLLLAGRSPADIGKPAALPDLAALARSYPDRMVDRDERGIAWSATAVTTEQTGWTGVTFQERDDFQGDLTTAMRRVKLTVIALLLIAGTGLVALSRKRERALARIAVRDDLTGALNRRGWFEAADQELRRAEREGQARVLLFVDLDGLKQINDVLGHREGDRAISSAARVLRDASRSTDVLGRLGGDEFVLLLGAGGDAEVARRRVLDALATHNARSGSGYELRLSIGAELWFPHQECSLDELVRRADEQMYAHKRSRPHRGAGVVRPDPERAARG